MAPGNRLFQALAGLNGLVGVAALAASTHAFDPVTQAQQQAWMHTAATFQLLHGIAFLAMVTGRLPGSRIVAALWGLGLVLFCGSLYWLAANGPGSLGPFHPTTPMGGLCFMAGWLVLGLGAMRRA